MLDQSFSTVKMIVKSNFTRRGLSIVFPAHVTKRATDGDRGADVQDQHVLDALSKVLRLYDAKDPRLLGIFEAVRRLNRGVDVVFVYPYDNTSLNIPCEIEPYQEKNSKFKIIVKTIMVKPVFKPHSSHDIVVILR